MTDDRRKAWMRCGACLATGKVEQHRARAISRGRDLRYGRQRHRWSIGEMARRMRITVVEMSRMEAGL